METLKYFANQVVDGITGGDGVISQTGQDDDLIGPVQGLINGFLGIIGLVAVIMIIIGAVQLQTSQGDTGKVKKGKDSIMYGIIGLVIALLAFAIVNFVLGSIL